MQGRPPATCTAPIASGCGKPNAVRPDADAPGTLHLQARNAALSEASAARGVGCFCSGAQLLDLASERLTVVYNV